MNRPMKICDICGKPFRKGIRIKGFRKKSELMCEKCENVMKLMILRIRSGKEI